MLRGLRKDSQWWLPSVAAFLAEEGAGGAGENKDDGKGSGNADGGGQQSGTGDDANKPFATFPTAEAFMARVKQEANSSLKTLAAELGYEDVSAMKEALKAKKEADDAAKTESDKNKEKAEQAEKQIQLLREQSKARLVNSELKVFAVQAGFTDPDDAVAFADRKMIEVSEDNDKVTGVKEAIDELIKAKPYLVGKPKPGSTGGGSVNPGGDGGGLSEEEIGKRKAEEVTKARTEASKQGEDPWSS